MVERYRFNVAAQLSRSLYGRSQIALCHGCNGHQDDPGANDKPA